MTKSRHYARSRVKDDSKLTKVDVTDDDVIPLCHDMCGIHSKRRFSDRKLVKPGDLRSKMTGRLGKLYNISKQLGSVLEHDDELLSKDCMYHEG